MERRPPPKKTWYFAYGSNLHLAQMAKRCPNSRYIGRATLEHYKWMINERGFANVVRANGYWVEGLVFELNGDDERRLDKNEGVAKECYLKKYERLQVHPGPKVLYRRPVPWIVEKGGPAAILEHARREGNFTREHRGKFWEEVLVYASPAYVKESVPREEYIKRINNGIDDARILGMSNEYISRFVRASIPVDGQATTLPKPSTVQRPAQQTRRMSFDDQHIQVDQNGGGHRGRLRQTMRTGTDRGRPPAKLQSAPKRRAQSVSDTRPSDPYSLLTMPMLEVSFTRGARAIKRSMFG